MPHYVVTYNIDDATNRADFVEKFEQALQDLGLNKEDTNQSTYFGHNANAKQGFITALFNAVNRLDWKVNDQVTVYYPKVTDKKADIGRHLLKEKGNTFLHHNIIG